MKYKLNFFSQYHQFYIYDKSSPQKTGSDDFWSNQAFADKLAVEDGILGIGIENDEGNVDCELEILSDKTSVFDFTKFDHIVEASINIKSGILQVLDCPNSHVELEIKIEPGNYRVRAYSSNLNSAYDEDPKDSYKLEIWKEAYWERKVLKRYLE